MNKKKLGNYTFKPLLVMATKKKKKHKKRQNYT